MQSIAWGVVEFGFSQQVDRVGKLHWDILTAKVLISDWTECF